MPTITVLTDGTNSKANPLVGSLPTNWFDPAFDDSAWPVVARTPGVSESVGAEVMRNGQDSPAPLIHLGAEIPPSGIQLISNSAATFNDNSRLAIRWTFNLTTLPTAEPTIALVWPVLMNGQLQGTAYINGTAQTILMNPANWVGYYLDLVIGRNVIAIDASVLSGGPNGWNNQHRELGMYLSWDVPPLPSRRGWAAVIG